MSSRSREISVAEFFEKNKHVLGYTNPSKALVTVVKEAVDNSLDACEDEGILPDIYVRISKIGENYKIIVEDNGPGIEREFLPKVFGKLLYGSRFHEIKQSRGQQGIGISGAILYAQLTTGKPAKIISRVKGSKAYSVTLYINTKKNEPEIVEEKEEEWFMSHGTRIELEIAGNYVKERKQSVYEYLKETAIVNPYARITFVEPDGTVHEFERLIEEVPKLPRAIKPHPHGIELGKLIQMLRDTKEKNLRSFLKEEFVRVGDKIAESILSAANLTGEEDPKELKREQAEALIKAFKQVDLLPPPTDCLLPIGDKNLEKSLLLRFKPEFVAAVTRKPKVYSGHPFLIEVGLAYGGEIDADKAIILRYANKIPLLYQQSGCALTKVVEMINWKNYGINQNIGELPSAPMVVLIHLASTNVPYTSESKEAIAEIVEIMEEAKLAIQEVGRRLKEYLDRKEKQKMKKKKEEEITKIIPLIAKKAAEILDKEVPNYEKILARIMGYVYVERVIKEMDGYKDVKLFIHNFSKSRVEMEIYELCNGTVEAEAEIEDSNYKTLSWKVVLKPEDVSEISYRLKGSIVNPRPIVRCNECETVKGAEVLATLK
ncbi:MAG: DNA topoisomerase VI subunit B [Archaeoglobales archaeon]|nr:DNA topoisomerase VI subunit B [Archaeoglobales archaeon]